MRDTIRKELLGELVAKEIKEGIWNKQLELGQRLIESDLSEHFNVSRNTIRDALKLLKNEALVISQPRKGTYITQLSSKDCQEIIELRLLIERYAFVKAIPHLEARHFEQLSEILDEMKRSAVTENWGRLFDLDLQFHSYMVNLSNNTQVIKIYESIQGQIRLILISLDKYYPSAYAFYLEQQELFDVLQTKNKTLIEDKINVHIEYLEGKLIVDYKLN